MDNRPVILIVDDTPENLRVLGNMLESEYEVRIATNGIQALDSVRISAPDLILLDVMMPEMDGFTVCRQLKSHPDWAMLPVIVVSALDAPEQKLRAFREGAVDYITKPFQADEVVARVRTHLQLSRFEDLKREVDERKRAEMALLESEERTRQIIETALDAVVTMDATGHITGWNPQAEVIFGWSAAEIIGRALAGTIIPQSQRLQHEQGFRRYLQTGVSRMLDRRLELTALRRNLEEFPVELTVAAVQVRGEQQFSAFIRDITERQRVEKELRESEARERRLNERFSLAVDSAGIGVWDYDIVNGVLVWDEQMFHLYPVDPEKFSGTYDAWERGIHPDDITRANMEVQQAIRGEQPFDTEFRVLWPSGEVRHIKANARVVRDAEGNPVRLIGVNYDISGRKRAEAQREELQLQLRQSHKMEAIGTLAGGIAHDFNNILGAIIGHAELLRQSVDLDEAIETSSLDAILHAAGRATDLVRQILTFSRRSDVIKKPVRLDLVVAEAMKLLRGALPAIIEIKQDLAPCPGLVLADAVHMHQIVMNLCTNAAHAMGDRGGLLTVGIGAVELKGGEAWAPLNLQPDRYLTLTVSDTGCGIAAEHLDHIFEPFFTSKAQGEGTGLGLAVVHGIVQEHGGGIVVESEAGRGTTIRILLPQLRDVESAGSIIKPPSKYPEGHERILLVDDEEPILNVMSKMLTKLGYDVVARDRAAKALDLVVGDQEHFDLIITDLMMPVMTGKDLRRQIDEAGISMRMILSTGYSESLTLEKAKELGFGDLLRKPLGIEELATRVRRVLDGEV
ncbi:MAG: response regulator [Candidatus Hydrogenedentes bacterium]|nr:response regulator [Candidatus Hydrogenedentota bacterium]